MFDKSSQFRSKREVSVTLSLAGDEMFDARVFLKYDERLIDLLNDDRAFIPVRREDGATIIVAKANIVSIVERAASEETEAPAGGDPVRDAQDAQDKAEAEAGAAFTTLRRRPLDPYATLRVAREASLEEIRKAYKARIKAVHPDTLSGLDIDDEIAKAALLATQKVTRAYQAIVRERQEAARQAKGEEAGSQPSAADDVPDHRPAKADAV